ncbi:uncharacterized protein HD556DRAFT_1305508 [Suillus plorans]|uniref:Uncharacterized protein n=1 Tax=Suillus plorans TaxID=116603 RepID=A0A9P7DNR1_9AGAM|nr:uncharacterized protein HD556DRAFT_1305508 [Suillus plorans]KAG1799267.1 hypothetical protein HD556DRAFT_1305508 [Suillus plorans]
MDRLGAHRRKRHERTINSSRSTRQNLSSAWLERRVHEEIQEVHSVMDLLDNYRSDATMEDSDGCDSTIDSKAGLDTLNAILPSESSHDPCFGLQHAPHEASFGVVESSSEGTEGLLPHGARSCADYVTQPQHSMYSAGIPAFPDPRVMELSSDGVDARFDLPLHGASDSVHEPAAKPFQGIYFEGNAPLSSAARPDAELFVPVEQATLVDESTPLISFATSSEVEPSISAEKALKIVPMFHDYTSSIPLGDVMIDPLEIFQGKLILKPHRFTTCAKTRFGMVCNRIFMAIAGHFKFGYLKGDATQLGLVARFE